MEKFSKKEIIIQLLFIILFPLLFGSLFFVTPWFGDVSIIDDGQMSAWISHMLNGKKMFSDIYITYGPLYIYPLYLFFKNVGADLFGLRFYYGGVGVIFGLLAVYLFVLEFKFRRVIFYPLLILLVVIPGASIRQGVLFLSLWLMTVSAKWKVQILWGMSIPLAFLVSPDAGILAAIISFIYLLSSFVVDKNIKNPIRSAGLFGIGAIFIVALFLAWSYSEGWLFDYLSTTVDILKSFSGSNLPNGKAFPDSYNYLTSNFPSISWIRYLFSKDMMLYYQFFLFALGFLYLFAKFIQSKFGRREKMMAVTVLVGILYYYTLIGRSGNFFLALTPSLLLIACFAEMLLTNTTKGRLIFLRKSLLILIMLLILRILYIFSPSFQNIAGLFNYETPVLHERWGNIKISKHQERYLAVIQNYIQKNTSKGDYIFFLSNEPVFYFLTDRVNPTRYDLPYIAHTREKRYEMLQDLQRNPPKLIFYDTLSWPVDEISNKKRLPEIMTYIKANYSKQTIYGGRVEVFIINNEN